uniref:Tudor domain-containing protein n=1 Tax=Tetranychus urticae TaxID=32264 RepID=T1KZS6_TETUR
MRVKWADYKCFCIEDGFVCQVHLSSIHVGLLEGQSCKPNLLPHKQASCKCDSCLKFVAKYKSNATNKKICLDCYEKVKNDGITYEPIAKAKENFVMAYHEEFKLSKLSVGCKLSQVRDGADSTIIKTGKIQEEMAASLATVNEIYDAALANNKAILTRIEKQVKLLTAQNDIINKKQKGFGKLHQAILDGAFTDDTIISTLREWFKSILNYSPNMTLKRVNFDIQAYTGNATKVTVKPIEFDECSNAQNVPEAVLKRQKITEEKSLTRMHPMVPCSSQMQSAQNDPRLARNPDRSLSEYFSSVHDARDKDMPHSDTVFFENDENEALNEPVQDIQIIEKQEAFYVYVTHVKSPLWIYLEKPESVDERAKILDAISKKAQEWMPVKDSDLDLNQAYIVRDVTDKKRPFKRAILKSENLDDKSYRVTYLDYGNDAKVYKDKIGQIKDFDVSKHSTVFKAKLVRIKPPSNFVFIYQAPFDPVKFIKSNFLNETCRAKVMKKYKAGESTFVEIYSKVKNKIINWSDALIKAKLALPYDEDPPCFNPTKTFCYDFHITGDCSRSVCWRSHLCPYCQSEIFDENLLDAKDRHSLMNCNKFQQMLKTTKIQTLTASSLACHNIQTPNNLLI